MLNFLVFTLQVDDIFGVISEGTEMGGEGPTAFAVSIRRQIFGSISRG
jgi:hypothetical protein